MHNTSFIDKTVLLTGATGGIGRQILKEFINLGAKVVASGSQDESLKTLREEFGANVLPMQCNLRDHSAIKKLVNDAKDAMGSIDILVCNAGMTRDNLGMLMKIEEWEDVINVNLTATFLLNQFTSKVMLRNKYGRIVNIASVVGCIGNPGQANYVASKAGMIGLAKTLAAEFATRNITVNCIAPGFITSPMTEKLTEAMKVQIAHRIPMQKMGLAEDIAHGVLFLASERSNYITGHTLHINGGMFMN